MTELHPLLEAVRVVRRRTAINGFLLRWRRALVWIFAGLLIAATFLPVQVVIVLATSLLILGAAGSALASWMLRPSIYESARQLDRAAGLRDRISTAVHFASIDNPHEMILRQRRDALGRLAQADPRALFPFHVRALGVRTSGLALAVVALLAYRISHEAPLMVVLDEVARSASLGALMPPQHQERTADRRKGLALFDRLDIQHVEDRAVEPKSAFSAAESSTPDAGNPDAPLSTGAGQQTGVGAQEDDASKASEGRPREGSLTDRIRRALKDLFAKATGQTPEYQDQQPSSKTGSENASSQQSGGEPSIRSPQSSQSKAQGEGKSGEGSGSDSTDQPGDGNRPSANSGAAKAAQNPSLQTHSKEDVVTLSYTDFKGQARVLTTLEKGKALVALRDASPQPIVTTNGAEQDDVPLRYRAYIQRYFQHSEERPR